MTAHAIKHNHKPTATPPSTVTAAEDNHFFPSSDDDDDNDDDPSDLMGKYDGGGNKKGKEDIVVGTGTTTRSRLSTDYTRKRRTTMKKAVKMNKRTAIGTSWRIRNRRRMRTMTMT